MSYEFVELWEIFCGDEKLNLYLVDTQRNVVGKYLCHVSGIVGNVR